MPEFSIHTSPRGAAGRRWPEVFDALADDREREPDRTDSDLAVDSGEGVSRQAPDVRARVPDDVVPPGGTAIPLATGR